MLKVLIPQAFENMEEATIGRWLVAEGDAIRESSALCELITEKTTFDLPAEKVPDGASTLLRIISPEKSIVPVGYCIALVGDESAELADWIKQVEVENARVVSESATRKPEADTVSVPVITRPVQVSSTPAAGSRIRATPAARRAAKDRGIELEIIAAALPGKVLTEEDVNAFEA